MKVCFNSEEDIFIHADGSISKCALLWSIKQIKPSHLSIPIEQCENICGIKCDRISSINILLGYKCVDGCSCCGDHLIFKNLNSVFKDISKVNLDSIMQSFNLILDKHKTVKYIQIGSYFDSTYNIKYLSQLINKISEQVNLPIQIYHMGITSLTDLYSKLTDKSIKQACFIINLNGTKNIHNKYKPNTYDVIMKNIVSNNKKLNIKVNTLLFEDSFDELEDIFNVLEYISNYVEELEIKIDNCITRLNKFRISKTIIFLKAFLYKKSIKSKKLHQAISNCINDNGKKSKFILTLANNIEKLNI